MSTQTLDNVIAFNEARAHRSSDVGSITGRRIVKPESVGVINDCRDMALSRICTALSSTFDKIEDELFELAGKSPDRESQNMYLDARTQSREKRKEMETAFRSHFVSFFEKKVSGVEPAAKTAAGFDMSQLSLVEDDALTQDIAVNDIAKRLTNKCDEELRALSQRMGFLLSEPELADEANPISPDNIVSAMKAALDQMTAGFQTKLTVLRMVEQHMSQEMLTVYHDLNSHLVSKQILPVLRPSFRKAQTQIVRKSAAERGSPTNGSNDNPASTEDAVGFGGQQGGGGADGGSAAPPSSAGFGAFSAAALGMPPANQAVELFRTLQQLMAGGVSFGPAGSAAQVAPEYSSFTTGGFAPVPPSSRSVLGGNSGGNVGGNAGTTAGGSATTTAHYSSAAEAGIDSAALIAALSQVQHQWLNSSSNMMAAQLAHNFVPGQSVAADLNVLRELKAQAVVQGSNQVDAMTIDIVAMLFDYVFDDKTIPDTIKALIARLQIPVLKVAILDKAFFSKKAHPVRRLLDVLADASVAFSGEASHDDPLYKKIEAIVNRVHGEFDTDISLFDEMIVEFESFLRARENANAEVIEQSARAMHEREKREMARMVAQAEVERQINHRDLPGPVAAMIRGPWARVLERVYVRDGGRGARFTEAVDTAEQLVWSVESKANASQRRDLVAALPLLLKRLQEGLDIASVDSEERRRFFTALVDCHAAAVKAGLRGESVSALFAASADQAAVAPLFEKLIAEERARDSVTTNINRSGVARIQFTDKGVEIEELIASKDGASVTSAQRASDGVVAGSDAVNAVSGGLDFNVDPATPAIQPAELKRGIWVEFLHTNGQDSGQKIRAKLSWISPLKGVYLFTNPGATEALSIAPDALHRQLARGTARVLEESSLIGRAVDRMVTSLSSAVA